MLAGLVPEIFVLKDIEGRSGLDSIEDLVCKRKVSEALAHAPKQTKVVSI